MLEGEEYPGLGTYENGAGHVFQPIQSHSFQIKDSNDDRQPLT